MVDLRVSVDLIEKKLYFNDQEIELEYEFDEVTVTNLDTTGDTKLTLSYQFQEKAALNPASKDGEKIKARISKLGLEDKFELKLGFPPDTEDPVHYYPQVSIKGEMSVERVSAVKTYESSD